MRPLTRPERRALLRFSFDPLEITRVMLVRLRQKGYIARFELTERGRARCHAELSHHDHCNVAGCQVCLGPRRPPR